MPHATQARNVLWKPHPGQQEKYFRRPEFEVLFGGAKGGGKALALDTPLPTPTGWTTMGEVQPGDWLLDDQGKPCRVLAATEVMYDHPVYEVVFDDGSVIKADAGHRWLTFDLRERQMLLRRSDAFRERRRATRPSRGTGKKQWLAERNRKRHYELLPPPTGTVRTTHEIMETLRRKVAFNHAVPVAKAIDLPEAELPLDPYLLGCWLGDGGSYDGKITTADESIVQAFRESGFRVSQYDRYQYGIIGLRTVLGRLGLLRNKHVPVACLRASRQQRLALLAGLMDTDGTVLPDGQCEFYTTNPRLAQDIYELLVSLGIKCSIVEGRAKLNGKDCGPKYRIKFCPDFPVFRLERKLSKQRFGKSQTRRFRYIVEVRPVSSEPVRCVQVDSPSHLYLAGRAMIPTHNSDCLLIDAVRHAHHPRYRAIILRRELKDAEDLIDRSRRLFPAAFPGASYNKNEHKWYFPSGATLQFGHSKEEADIYAFNGREFHFIGFDELQEFTHQQYVFMHSTARSSVLELKPRIRATANPGGIGHVWIDQRFGITRGLAEKTIRDPKTGLTRCWVPSSWRDNPSLDPTYKAQLDALPDKMRRAYRDGDWTVFAGQYFDEWDPDVHVLKSHLDPDPSWPVFHAMDWGYESPYSYGLYALMPTGQLYRFAELYGWSGEPNVGSRETAETVARKIRLLWEGLGLSGRDIIGPADTQMWDRSGEVGPSIADTFHLLGVQFVKANKDRINGWNRCRWLLGKDAYGQPRFIVSPRCTHFIRTIPALVHDEKRVEDVNTKGEDHAGDEFRYMAMFDPKPSQEAYSPTRHRRDEPELTYNGVRLMFEQEPSREWWE